jgi:hypothetical protein
MKNHLLLAVIPALLLISFRYAADEWTKYISREGHFSIDFPGKPIESAENDTTDAKKSSRVHYITYFPNDSEGYMADWTDMHKTYPKEMTITQILEYSRDGAMRSVIATNVTTTATNLGKEPYIEFTFSNKDFSGKGRIYVINKFQYAIITLFSHNAGISSAADKFIKSFKHLQ